jgi:2-hydroxychromene-2-carboxylate isomerase
MPLDPSIISGLRPVQIDAAQFSPMNAMMGAMKLRQLDQEGELNALTLKERKGLQAFLPGKDLSDPEVRYQLAANFGETGRKIAAGVTSIGTAQTAEGQRRISAADRSALRASMASRPKKRS